MKNKRIVKLWFYITMILLSFVSILNYYIDSLNIFGRDNYLNIAAKKLTEGNIIAGLVDFDERTFKKNTILNLKYEPNFVAIGSSRVMQIRKNTLKQPFFHNYGVSGASLEDYIGLTWIHYKKFEAYPKNIIFGIDPWIFNKNNDQNRYKSIEDDYLTLKNIFTDKKRVEKTPYNILKLLSIEYAIKNIISLTKDKFYIVNSADVDAYLREPDGSIYYPFKFRYPNPDNVKQDAINYAKAKPVYSLREFEHLDNTKLFESFIKFLISQGTKVYFFLPPYNPYTYNLLIQNPKYYIINKVELYLKDFAKANNIKVIGSYNPNINELKNEDFFDGMHLLENGYMKIFKDLN